MRINFAVIEDKVEQILRAWETTAPEQSFADMSLEQFKQALQPYFAAKAAFVTIGTQWDSAQQARVEGAGARDGYRSFRQRPSQVRCEQQHVRSDGLHDEGCEKLRTDEAAGSRNAEGDGLIEGGRHDRTM